jgi:hypothetical protein
MQGVLDGEALAQELGIPGDFDSLDCGEIGCDGVSCAHGHGRLTDNQIAGLQVRRQGCDRAEDLGHVGGVRAGLLRRTHADEVHIGKGACFRKTGRESESASLDIASKHFVEPGLIEGHATALEQLNLGGVDVNTDHLETELSHACRMGCAEVAGADDRQTMGHARRLSGAVP